MKKFEFRLARVQKLRERARESRRIAHAEALAYRQRVLDQIEQVQATRAAEKENVRQVLQGDSFSLDQIIQSRIFDVRLQSNARQLNQHLEQVEKVVEQRRGQLMAAEKDVKILEKLGEISLNRYNDRLAKEDQLMMDELAIQASLRRSGMNDNPSPGS